MPTFRLAFEGRYGEVRNSERHRGDGGIMGEDRAAHGYSLHGDRPEYCEFH